MRIETARTLAEIFKRIQNRPTPRRHHLLNSIHCANIPEEDERFLHNLVEHYVARRTQLTTDLRRRSHDKIISECFEWLEPEQVREITTEVTISVGALSFNFLATEKGLALLNQAFDDDEAPNPAAFFSHRTIGQSSAAGCSSPYPYNILGIDRFEPLDTEERLMAAIFDDVMLPLTEQHENVHHLFDLVMSLLGRNARPFKTIITRKKRVDKLTELGAPDIIMRNENLMLLEALQTVVLGIQSLDDITELDWEEITAAYQQELTQWLYDNTASELLARLYTGEEKNLRCLITEVYLPGWLKDFDFDLDEAKYHEHLVAAINALIRFSRCPVPYGVRAMILIDHDIRDWPSVVDEIIRPTS